MKVALPRFVRTEQNFRDALANKWISRKRSITYSLNQSCRVRLQKSRCYCLNLAYPDCAVDDAVMLCLIEPMCLNPNRTVVCGSFALNQLINSLLRLWNFGILIAYRFMEWCVRIWVFKRMLHEMPTRVEKKNKKKRNGYM